PQRSVFRPRQRVFSIRQQQRARYPRLMAGERVAHRLARLQVPPPQRPVTRPGQRAFSIPQQQRCQYRTLMTAERCHKGATGRFEIRKPGPQLLTKLLTKFLTQSVEFGTHSRSKPTEKLLSYLARIPHQHVGRLAQSVAQEANRGSRRAPVWQACKGEFEISKQIDYGAARPVGLRIEESQVQQDVREFLATFRSGQVSRQIAPHRQIPRSWPFRISWQQHGRPQLVAFLNADVVLTSHGLILLPIPAGEPLSERLVEQM